MLLNQFLLETICKYQNGPNIILDVQSIDIATQAANIIGNGLCPTVGNSRLKYSSKVSMKLFPHSTTPASIIAGTPRAEDIPARVVHHYNRHTNNFKIYFQFNSGSFDGSTCNNPFNDCQLKLRDGLTERNVSMAEFRNQIMLLNDVAGVALSAPPIHTDTSSTYRAAINNTMNRQLSWFNSNKNGKKLISIASRPDDRKLYTTRGLHGSQQNEERCFMYNYNGDNSGRISLYVSSVYSSRNAYANNPEFDYIIADAYINGSNLDWDEALEVELLCGSNKSIIHSFRKKGGESAAQSTNDYKSLTWEQDREYYYLTDLKGRSQIEQYYSKK